MSQEDYFFPVETLKQRFASMDKEGDGLAVITPSLRSGRGFATRDDYGFQPPEKRRSLFLGKKTEGYIL